MSDGVRSYIRSISDAEFIRLTKYSEQTGQLPPEYGLEREDIKVCSPPATAWNENALVLDARDTSQESDIVSASGRWSACDLWLQAPTAWGAVTLTIYGRSGEIEIPLRTVALGAVPRFTRGVGAGARFVTLPISIRGRTCDGFVVRAQAVNGGPAFGEATARLECWHCEDQVPIDQFANAAAPSPVTPSTVEIDNSGQAFTDSRIIVGPRRLRALTGRSIAAVTRFIMIFDDVAVPVLGTAPVRVPIEVLPGESFNLGVGELPTDFANGIVWAASSTDATLTATGLAEFWIDTYHSA